MLGTIFEAPEVLDELPTVILDLLAVFVRRWVTELEAATVRVCVNGGVYAFSSSPHASEEVVSITQITGGILAHGTVHVDPAPIVPSFLRELGRTDVCIVDLGEPSVIWVNDTKTERPRSIS
jgi:hypothetical protein